MRQRTYRMPASRAAIGQVVPRRRFDEAAVLMADRTGEGARACGVPAGRGRGNPSRCRLTPVQSPIAVRTNALSCMNFRPMLARLLMFPLATCAGAATVRVPADHAISSFEFNGEILTLAPDSYSGSVPDLGAYELGR